MTKKLCEPAPVDVPLPEPDMASDFAPNAKVYHAPLVQKLVNEAAHWHTQAKVAAERERLRGLIEAVRDANNDATFRLLTPDQERAWGALLAEFDGSPPGEKP
jgi:hypothetical protein